MCETEKVCVWVRVSVCEREREKRVCGAVLKATAPTCTHRNPLIPSLTATLLRSSGGTSHLIGLALANLTVYVPSEGESDKVRVWTQRVGETVCAWATELG